MTGTKFLILPCEIWDADSLGNEYLHEMFPDREILSIKDAKTPKYEWLYTPVDAKDGALGGFYREQLAMCRKDILDCLDKIDEERRKKSSTGVIWNMLNRASSIDRPRLFEHVTELEGPVLTEGHLEMALDVDGPLSLCGYELK